MKRLNRVDKEGLDRVWTEKIHKEDGEAQRDGCSIGGFLRKARRKLSGKCLIGCLGKKIILKVVRVEMEM